MGREHPVDIVRPGLRPDHDHLLAPIAPALRQVSVEGHLPYRPSWGDIQTGGDHLSGFNGLFLVLRVELGMEEEVDLLRGDPEDRLLFGDQPLLGQLHSDPHGGLGRPLARPSLEDPELTPLDGELDVLDIAVVALQLLTDLYKLIVDLRHLLLELGDPLGLPDPGHHILSLGVEEVVPFDPLLPGGDIPGGDHPGPGVLAHVPEDHHLDIDRRPEVMGYPRGLAVVHRPLPGPGLEDGLDGQIELLFGILREVPVGMISHDLLELLGDLLPVLGPELGVGLNIALLAELGDQDLESLIRDSQDDRAEHLDQPAVDIVGEALVPCLCQLEQSSDGLIVEADIEDGIHHPRHGDRRPGADRDEQGIPRVAEASPGQLFQLGHPRGDLLLQPLGVFPVVVVVATGIGGDGEPRGDG